MGNTLPGPPKHLSTPARRLSRETVEALEAEEILRTAGLVVEGRYGVRAHPAVAIARDARTQFARLLREIDLEGIAGAGSADAEEGISQCLRRPIRRIASRVEGSPRQ